MAELKKATFAGGCFWCMVKPFDQWDGVEKVVSGYTGGHVKNPIYEEVKSGHSGHYEAVEITYDPDIMPYETILKVYWRQIDPTDDGGQFQDRGDSYRTAIFYHDSKQQSLAEKSRKQLEDRKKFTKPIVTKILPAEYFYPAETYHQDFYKTHEKEYKKDRSKSGRDTFISNHWTD